MDAFDEMHMIEGFNKMAMLLTVRRVYSVRYRNALRETCTR